MARRGLVVDEAHPVRWAAPSALNQAILELMDADSGYRTSSASLDRMTFTRTFRPNWALAAAAVLGITGVGLCFLLVRATETFTCAIDDDHAGVRLRLHGRVEKSVLAAPRKLRDARLAPPPGGLPSNAPSSVLAPAAVGVPQSAAPSPWLLGGASGAVSAPPGSGTPWAAGPGIAARPNEPQAPLPSPVRADESTRMVSRSSPSTSGQTSPSGQWVIHIEGEPPIEMGSRVVVGRNPAVVDGDGSARLVPVSDQSVSKTHAEFGVDDRGAWVLDRHSTNGTRIIDLTGERVVVPGERAPLSGGAMIRLGEVLVRVEVR